MKLDAAVYINGSNPLLLSGLCGEQALEHEKDVQETECCHTADCPSQLSIDAGTQDLLDCAVHKSQNAASNCL